MTANPTGNGTDRKPIIASYQPDHTVDAEMDRQLRSLLSACFTAPEHARFRKQRFFYTPYPHRWLLKMEDGQLVGHAGIHDRILRCESEEFPCAGIADVCVHPDVQGRGLLRRLLADIHAWLRGRSIPFAVLFGDEPIYRSSGYRPVQLRLEHPPAVGSQPVRAMAISLNSIAWPSNPTTLSGGFF